MPDWLLGHESRFLHASRESFRQAGSVSNFREMGLKMIGMVVSLFVSVRIRLIVHSLQKLFKIANRALRCLATGESIPF